MFVTTEKLWSRKEILYTPSPVPKENGVYAWYFKNIPTIIPIENCIVRNNSVLLYIGISPKSPPQNGKPKSRQSLFQRVRYHMTGNAEGSTLRLSLGCLLGEELNIQLRRVGSGNRMTFVEGEKKISEWQDKNSFVAWVCCDRPWELESELLAQLSLPLNLDQNRNHQFHAALSGLRKSSRDRARELPIV